MGLHRLVLVWSVTWSAKLILLIVRLEELRHLVLSRILLTFGQLHCPAGCRILDLILRGMLGLRRRSFGWLNSRACGMPRSLLHLRCVHWRVWLRHIVNRLLQRGRLEHHGLHGSRVLHLWR